MNCSPRAKAITIFLLLLSFSGWGQKQLVTLQASPSLRIQAGQTGQLMLPFEVIYPYHIQADTVNDENLIATQLTFEGSGDLIIDSIEFPEFKRFQLRGSSDELLVFDGPFEVLVSFDARHMEQGSYLLTGGLYYQACDEKRCLFPRRLNFELPVEVDP